MVGNAMLANNHLALFSFRMIISIIYVIGWKFEVIVWCESFQVQGFLNPLTSKGSWSRKEVLFIRSHRTLLWTIIAFAFVQVQGLLTWCVALLVIWVCVESLSISATQIHYQNNSYSVIEKIVWNFKICILCSWKSSDFISSRFSIFCWC